MASYPMLHLYILFLFAVVSEDLPIVQFFFFHTDHQNLKQTQGLSYQN
ncbi:hypothetical protein HMPREF3212_03071 [Citrobacter freundii]|nr:hypothetical protein HMPREF3212_03071 [Citrobacter freundii]